MNQRRTHIGRIHLAMRWLVIAVAALLWAGTGSAGADTGIPPTVQGLANYVATQVPPAARPIVDSGSSAGYRSLASDAVGEGPEMSAYLAAFGYGLLHPDAAPPGANRWDCKPSAAHPRPVVLVHGTWLNAYDSFAYMSPKLERAGYCVFAFNFGRSGLLDGGGLGSVLPGRYGVGPMDESAQQLGDFVDRVLAATHTDRVDIIAHSQGGTISDQYLKFAGGGDKVGKLVTFGATRHGTSLLGMATLARIITNLGVDLLGFERPIIGPANVDQAVGSSFLTHLGSVGDTVPKVDYTVVGSRYDEVMNPLQWVFLRPGPGATVDNVTLQDGCEQDLSDHLTMMYSPRSMSIVLHALDPAAHPDLVCEFNPWLTGGGGHW